ncbi:nucleoside hydrolase [Hymenopellis radicata]|nr:nucleoside hydrolase [Hymenopellis radicata]
MTSRKVWLDVDPGHDDATAILLAIHCPNIDLLGISTVHGNASADHTAINAARCLLAFGASPNLRVYPGASKPLLRPAKHDPEIHGPDGLGGVEGFPATDDPAVLEFIAKNPDGSTARALDGMTTAIRRAIEEFVFMGGGVGLGNRSAVAEYNIMCDPHAAQIVLDAPVPAVMIPINVTHTAIADRSVMWRLLSPDSPVGSLQAPLPDGTTPLRHTLMTLIRFFAEAYKSTFGFADGPPIHDALTVAYVSRPDLFASTRYRVDVELTGTHSTGETVVDVWNYLQCDDSWGSTGRNCIVTQSLQVEEFFDKVFLDCVKRCDALSPLNSNV